jgi:hypothetical protein
MRALIDRGLLAARPRLLRLGLPLIVRPAPFVQPMLLCTLHCAAQYGMLTPVRGLAVSSFGTPDAFLHSPPMVESSARSIDRAFF